MASKYLIFDMEELQKKAKMTRKEDSYRNRSQIFNLSGTGWTEWYDRSRKQKKRRREEEEVKESLK
ncbi:hypothetical protein RUM43_008110 [Polyplax serrata]|uniref:Uncharacterized protein n=1 Tax=Polyplax serrata TaxID=468196 RepID=A0AAN8P6L3_POLSC